MSEVLDESLIKALERQPCPIYLIDINGTILWTNISAQEIAGLDAGRIIGKRISNLSWNSRPETFLKLLKKANRQKTVDFETVLKKDDQCTLNKIHIFRLSDKTKRHTFGVAVLPSDLLSSLSILEKENGIILLVDRKIIFQNTIARKIFNMDINDEFILPTYCSQFESVHISKSAQSKSASYFQKKIMRNTRFRVDWCFKNQHNSIRFVDVQHIPLQKTPLAISLILANDKTESKLDELKFRILFQGSPAATCIIDKNCRILDANPAMINLFGYSRKELVGKIMPDFCYGVDRNIIKQMLLDESSVLNNIEIASSKKDGTPLMLLANASVQKIGTEPFIIMSFIDQTTEKEALISAETARRLYQDLFENIPISILFVDSNGRIMDCNKMITTLSQYKPDELVGQNVHRLFMQDISDQEALTNALKNGRAENIELRFVRKDGDIVYVLLDSLSIEIGTLLALRDITDLHRTLSELEMSTKKYDQLVSQLPIGVAVTDLKENILLANDALARIFGASKEELIGKSFLDFVSPSSKAIIQEQTNSHNDNAVAKYEVQIIRSDGSFRDVEIMSSWLKDESGSVIGTLGTIEDITHQKQLERMKQIQDQEITLYGRLLRHDLRNDLGLLQCYIEAIQMIESDLDPESIQFIESSLNVIERMNNLIRYLERPQPLTTVELGKYISELAEEANKSSTALIVKVNIDPKVKNEKIIAGTLLNLVFHNLFRNAEQHAGPKPVVSIDVRKSGSFAEMIVSDNGPGVPDELREKIFERGTSTKEGGGLGLHLCHEILIERGGSIELLPSEKGMGATFRILIPLVS